jgi:hypothetical protein
MNRWLPRLAGPDLVAVLITLVLILSASRVRQLGDWLDDRYRRLKGGGSRR